MPKKVEFKGKEFWLSDFGPWKFLTYPEHCDENGCYEDLVKAGYACISNGFVFHLGLQIGFEKDVKEVSNAQVRT